MKLQQLTWIGIWILVFLPRPGWADAETSIDTCGKMRTGPFLVRYCISKSEVRQNPDVLYFFHGANGSERTWIDKGFGPTLREQWASHGTSPPTVISISLGPLWLLTENSVTLFPGLYERFLQRILPALESQIGELNGGRRLVLGQSMGGFNAAQLLVKNGEMFAKFALICPALSAVSPHASQTEIQDYIQRTGAAPRLVQLLVAIARLFFPIEASWDRHDILTLAESSLGPDSPDLYLSANPADEFGFYEGAQVLHEIALQTGAPIQWDPVPGGHCTYEPDTLARFLTE